MSILGEGELRGLRRGLISITCYLLKILSISTGIFIIWNSYFNDSLPRS